MAREDTATAYQRIPVIQAAAGSLTVLAAIPGQKIKLVAFIGSLTADGTLKFFSDSTALSGPMDITGKSVIGIRSTEKIPVFKTAAGEALKFTSTGGGFNGYALVYVEGE